MARDKFKLFPPRIVSCGRQPFLTEIKKYDLRHGGGGKEEKMSFVTRRYRTKRVPSNAIISIYFAPGMYTRNLV